MLMPLVIDRNLQEITCHHMKSYISSHVSNAISKTRQKLSIRKIYYQDAFDLMVSDSQKVKYSYKIMGGIFKTLLVNNDQWSHCITQNVPRNLTKYHGTWRVVFHHMLANPTFVATSSMLTFTRLDHFLNASLMLPRLNFVLSLTFPLLTFDGLNLHKEYCIVTNLYCFDLWCAQFTWRTLVTCCHLWSHWAPFVKRD